MQFNLSSINSHVSRQAAIKSNNPMWKVTKEERGLEHRLMTREAPIMSRALMLTRRRGGHCTTEMTTTSDPVQVWHAGNFSRAPSSLAPFISSFCISSLMHIHPPFQSSLHCFGMVSPMRADTAVAACGNGPEANRPGWWRRPQTLSM
jgi:hypothetical protein